MKASNISSPTSMKPLHKHDRMSNAIMSSSSSNLKQASSEMLLMTSDKHHVTQKTHETPAFYKKQSIDATDSDESPTQIMTNRLTPYSSALNTQRESPVRRTRLILQAKMPQMSLISQLNSGALSGKSPGATSLEDNHDGQLQPYKPMFDVEPNQRPASVL